MGWNNDIQMYIFIVQFVSNNPWQMTEANIQYSKRQVESSIALQSEAV